MSRQQIIERVSAVFRSKGYKIIKKGSRVYGYNEFFIVHIANISSTYNQITLTLILYVPSDKGKRALERFSVSFSDAELNSVVSVWLDNLSVRYNSLVESFYTDLSSEFEAIASRYLGISTLRTQNSDSLDFHEVSVWSVSSSLLEAYRRGYIKAIKSWL